LVRTELIFSSDHIYSPTIESQTLWVAPRMWNLYGTTGLFICA